MASYTYMADSIRFTIEGKSAVDAIERNFNEIAMNAHVGNVEGNTLERVCLQDSVLHIIQAAAPAGQPPVSRPTERCRRRFHPFRLPATGRVG